MGAHKLWIAKISETFHPNTCLISNGFASMGFALPGAIAAQLAFPHRKIVVMCGDGGFLMNVQELETAVRLRLPLIVIIWCDREYGVISLKQIEEFGKKAFTEFNNPDFVKLAKRPLVMQSDPWKNFHTFLKRVKCQRPSDRFTLLIPSRCTYSYLPSKILLGIHLYFLP